MQAKNDNPALERGAETFQTERRNDNNSNCGSQLNPASIASEKAIIGATLEHDDLIMPVVAESGLKSTDFFLSEHRRIFDVILQLWYEKKHIDQILVLNRLGSTPQDGAVLSDCVHGVIVHPDHVADHIEVVRDKAQRRALLHFSEWLPTIVGDPAPADALIEQALQRLESIASSEVRV